MMRHYDGGTVGSAAVDAGAAKSSWSPRLIAVAVLLVAGLFGAVGAASAAPTGIVTPTTDVPPIGRWIGGGMEVDVPQLFGAAQWHSDRMNEPVEVDCVGGADAKVRGYFAPGDGLVTGWTSAKNVTTRGWTPPQCGVADYAAFAW